MRVGVVIQARLSSARLPGKVLRSLRGRPMLVYLLERLLHSPLLTDDRFNEICDNNICSNNYLGSDATPLHTDAASLNADAMPYQVGVAPGPHGVDREAIVLATSTDTSDDPLANYCAEQAIACHRGSLSHVAQRCCEAAQARGFEAFFRVCADSPMLDSRLFAPALEMAVRSNDWDLITNVAPRSFPPGQSVELVRTQTLARILPEIDRTDQREHVTRFFYEHPQRFTIRNFCAARSYGALRFTVDDPTDLRRTEKLLSTLAREHWTYSLDELVERMRLLDALEVKLSGVDL